MEKKEVKAKYRCKQCNAPVVVADGQIIRVCQCNTTIIADCESGIEAKSEVGA